MDDLKPFSFIIFDRTLVQGMRLLYTVINIS